MEVLSQELLMIISIISEDLAGRQEGILEFFVQALHSSRNDEISQTSSTHFFKSLASKIVRVMGSGRWEEEEGDQDC